MNRRCERIRPRLWLVPVIIALSAGQLSEAVRGDTPNSAGPVADQHAPHPLDPALEIARNSLQRSQANIQDYRAVLVKRLRINGELNEFQHLYVKIRNRKVDNGRLTTPLSVYLRFLRPESIQGRELIWVEGRNAGKIIVHEAGFKNLLRIHLDPAGAIAMRGQRYPVSDIGLENLIVKLIETGERDRRYGECDVQFFKNAKVGERGCTMIQVMHPVKRGYFDFYCARLFFDNELNLPIRYESWSWPQADGQPRLEEEYTYTGVKVNVGLTDRDFDPDNAEYDYP
jgi:hypothetical protein